MTSIESIGFIGTGAITAAIIKGLCSKGASPAIHVSPRSEAVSTALATEFPNISKAADNIEVVDRSQVVVLSVRPEQLDDALEGLAFRPEQTVISLVATVSLAEITRRVAPAKRVCRAIPLTTIEKRRGPIVMAPQLKNVKGLFDDLGDVLIADTEEQMTAFGCGAAVASSFFELEDTVAQWLSSQGVTPAKASLYVRSLLGGMAGTALDEPAIPFKVLAENNETPGGLNERVRLNLQKAGVFRQFEQVLSEIAGISLAKTDSPQTSPSSQPDA